MESLVTGMFGGFYAGRRVVVTGHTGFKGAWLSLWLHRLGATVHGIALDPPTQPNLYSLLRETACQADVRCDVRDLDGLRSALAQAAPEIVFHLAAQPLVRRSYKDPLETLLVNTAGTAHLLEAARILGAPWTIVVVTTDKCYENRAWPFAYRENDPLGGHDVYSMSKAAAELVVDAWRRSFFQTDPRLGRLASARAGNVIGGGDYAVDRLVPDAVRAQLEDRPIPVRNPRSVRPWQHVLDALSGYLCLGARLAGEPKDSPLASAFNFGPGPLGELAVRDLVEEWLRCWPGAWQPRAETAPPHEAGRLTLAIDKAASLLGWTPVWDVREAIRRTAAWYHARHVERRPDMPGFSLDQIAAYEADARARGQAWAAPDGAPAGAAPGA